MVTLDTRFWGLVAGVAGLGIGFLLAVVTYGTLRKTDLDTLKARIYLNHDKLLLGLFFLSVTMGILLSYIFASLIHLAWRESEIPLSVSTILISAVTAAFLVSMYAFYSMSRPASGATGSRGRGKVPASMDNPGGGED